MVVRQIALWPAGQGVRPSLAIELFGIVVAASLFVGTCLAIRRWYAPALPQGKQIPEALFWARERTTRCPIRSKAQRRVKHRLRTLIPKPGPGVPAAQLVGHRSWRRGQTAGGGSIPRWSTGKPQVVTRRKAMGAGQKKIIPKPDPTLAEARFRAR